MKTENNYETPNVEVIEVQVERGFATTGDAGGSGNDFDWDN